MPEIIDICDHEGHLTGESMARSEVHKQERWHRIAIVWIIDNQGRLLLQQRAEHLGCFPGVWDVSVDGHVAAGDEPTPTALREMKEELGITAGTGDLVFADTVTDRYEMAYGRTHCEYDFVFICRRDIPVEELRLQTAEVSSAKWVRYDELAAELEEHPGLYAGRNRDVYRIGIDAARLVAGESR